MTCTKRAEDKLLAKLRTKVFTGQELTEDQVEFIGIQYQRAILAAKAKHLGSWDIKLWALSQVSPMTPKHVFYILSRLTRDPEDFIWIKEELQKIHLDIMNETEATAIIKLQEQFEDIVSNIQLQAEKLEEVADDEKPVIEANLITMRAQAAKFELQLNEAQAKKEANNLSEIVLFDSNRINITANAVDHEVVLTQKATADSEEQVYIKKYHLQDLFVIVENPTEDETTDETFDEGN